jgi:hypothetical protein
MLDLDTTLTSTVRATHMLGFVLSDSDAFRSGEHIVEYMKFSFT